jgi:hypothetical protein
MSDEDLTRDNLATAMQALHDIANGANPGEAKGVAEDAIRVIVNRRMGLPDKITVGRVAVLIPPVEHGYVGWAKWVIGTNSQRTGYCFEGPFLHRGRRASLPPGAVVLIHTRQEGESKAARATAMIEVGVALHDGTLRQDCRIAAGKNWAVQLREPIAHFLTLPRT